MPRCVTNWEQRTAVAEKPCIFMRRPSMGPPLPFFLFFSLPHPLSLSLLSLCSPTPLETHTIKPAFTRGAVSRAKGTPNGLGKLIPPLSFSSLIVGRQCRGQCLWLTDFFDNETGNLSRNNDCDDFSSSCRFFGKSDVGLLIGKKNDRRDGSLNITRVSYGCGRRKTRSRLTAFSVRFSFTTRERRLIFDRATCTFQNNAGFFWDRADRERIFGGRVARPPVTPAPAYWVAQIANRAVFL